jgi:leader peptidase (prepilin peptidase)/N-methyltransferase
MLPDEGFVTVIDYNYFMAIILIIFVGWIGSICINYLADILPSFHVSASPLCPNCKAKRSWVFYLFPRQCQSCSSKLIFRYWIIFIVGIISAMLLWLFPRRNLPFGLTYLLLIYFILIIVIDIEHRLIIINPLGYIGLVLGLITGITLHGFYPTFIGGAVGFGITLILYYFGKWFAQFLSRRRGQVIDEEALGFGDVFLSIIMGFALGWPGIVAGLLLGIILGGLFSLGYLMIKLIKRQYQYNLVIPYAPFLIMGLLILLFR